MGIDVYNLIGKRNIKGEEVYKANYCGRMGDPRLNSKPFKRFDTKPLFVFDFKHLEKVYRKTNYGGYFYDCDDYGEHYGWLMKVGRAYQIITIDQLDEHVRSMSAFNDFADLIQASGPNYRPTIRAKDGYMNVVLADIFDDYWNETGPWIDPETKEVSKGIVAYRYNSDWKPQTQAYRG